MKQWTIPAGATTPADLELRDAPAPEPGHGEVVVRATALSINARDGMILRGPFGRTPGRDLVPLSDIAGVVAAVGDGVRDWAVGDRVMTAHVPTWQDGTPVAFGIGVGSGDDDGVAAEHVAVLASALVRIPDRVTDTEAATLQVAGVTAWNSVFGARPVRAGETVVVIGSGGVAVFATQLAVAAGATVVAAVKDDVDDPRWSKVGVRDVVRTDSGWGARLAEATGGADKVVNGVGPGMLPEALDALGAGGEVATPGLIDVTSPAIDFMQVIAKQASIRGVAVGSAEMHRQLAAYVAEHDVRPVIDTTVDFADLPAAYRALTKPDLFGKVVIAM